MYIQAQLYSYLILTFAHSQRKLELECRMEEEKMRLDAEKGSLQRDKASLQTKLKQAIEHSQSSRPVLPLVYQTGVVETTVSMHIVSHSHVAAGLVLSPRLLWNRTTLAEWCSMCTHCPASLYVFVSSAESLIEQDLIRLKDKTVRDDQARRDVRRKHYHTSHTIRL